MALWCCALHFIRMHTHIQKMQALTGRQEARPRPCATRTALQCAHCYLSPWTCCSLHALHFPTPGDASSTSMGVPWECERVHS